MIQHFIKTSDEKVAQELRDYGYIELSKQGNLYVFINDSKKAKTFDQNKIIYTDNLCM